MIPQTLVDTGVKRPFGPAGVFEMAIFLASSASFFSIVRSALIGFWIHEPRPEPRNWLLAVSSQDSTSFVIVLLYSSSALPTASFVSGELMATVLPSAATYEEPWVQRKPLQELLASLLF